MNKINWCEVKKSKDGTKEWKELTLEGGQKVSIWPNHPEYLKAAPGATVSGDIVVNGKYTNLVPSNVRTPYHSQNKGQPGAFTKAMDRKEQGIEKFQDSKELGIKISSTMRMAVDIVTARGLHTTLSKQNIQEEISMWRKWLWENWDAKDTDFDPFPSNPKTDEPPLDSYEQDYQSM